MACVGCLQGFFYASGRSSGLPVASRFPPACGLQAAAELTLNFSDIAKTCKDRLKVQPGWQKLHVCVWKAVKKMNKSLSCFKVKLELGATRP